MHNNDDEKCIWNTFHSKFAFLLIWLLRFTAIFCTFSVWVHECSAWSMNWNLFIVSIEFINILIFWYESDCNLANYVWIGFIAVSRKLHPTNQIFAAFRCFAFNWNSYGNTRIEPQNCCAFAILIKNGFISWNRTNNFRYIWNSPTFSASLYEMPCIQLIRDSSF